MKLLCTKCKKEKTVDHFRKDQHNPTGFHCHCNDCYNNNQREYYNKNLDKVRAYASDYYSKNKERILALRRARNAGEPTTILYKTSEKDRQIQKDYYNNREGWKKTRENGWKSRGIKNFTYVEFEQMKLIQNNKCYLCGSKPSKNQNLHVDHNHKTGKVRKLLCNNCNNGIGKLKDSIDMLEKAVKYLKEHE